MTPGPDPARPGLLVAQGLRKRFGAVTVLDGVDLRLGPGEAVGIVGPNGAGKTTLLNALSGAVRLDGGSVLLDGLDITSVDIARRCRMGIGRSFQIPRPFGGMTVFENLLVGATAGGGEHRAAAYDRCVDILAVCDLAGLANRRADSLGLLDRKRLEMARALATEPRVLLFDEIGGGLTDAEALALVETVAVLGRRGIAILWIEHIVHVLVRAVSRLICMDQGRVISEGEPLAVMGDAAVIDAYLGPGGR